jgi:ferric-dicitrate binding protein FerR (iron transport regulator)
MNRDEHDEYLWDKSGQADADVARLERLLKRYRYDASRDTGFDATKAERRAAVRWRTWALALAAGLALFFGARAWWSRDQRPSYEVIGIAGLERAYVGDSVETKADQTAIVRVATLGDVELRPDSRVRVDDVGNKLHKLFLDRGSVTATITAKPGLFQIGTPEGLSIDLGCKYELSVGKDGVTRMRVLTGRVRFEILGKTVVVPAGAECEAKQGLGPNVPVRVDASEAFRAAARRLELADTPEDFGKLVMCGKLEDRKLVFDDSDARDASVTLFHLFTNAKSKELGNDALKRLLVAYPMPEGVTLEMLRERDERSIDALRQCLGDRNWQ